MSVSVQGWSGVVQAIESGDFLGVFDALVAVGCRPVPLKRDSSGKIKMPRQNGWGKTDIESRRADMVFVLEQHARRLANVPGWVTSHGLGVQPDGYIVIDLDPPGKDRELLPQVVEEAANLLCGGECELPDTFGYDTAAGRHLWYKTTPAIVDAWKKGGKLQFALPSGGVAEIFTGHQGESGQMQVAFPPSDGKTYHAGTTVEPVELPESIEAAILAHFAGSVAENYVPYVPRPRAGNDGARIVADEERYFNTAVFDSNDCLVREVAEAPRGQRWITLRRVIIRCASLAAACGQDHRKVEILGALFDAYRSTGTENPEATIRSSTPDWAWGVGVAKPAYINWHEPHVTNPNFGRPNAGTKHRPASPDEFVDGDEFDGNPYIRNAYVGLVALRNLLTHNQQEWWWVRPALAEKWGAVIADQLTAKLVAELGINWPEPTDKSKRGRRRDLKWFQDKARAEGWKPEAQTGNPDHAWKDMLARVLDRYPNAVDPGTSATSPNQVYAIKFLDAQARRIVVWKGDVYYYNGSCYVMWDDKEFSMHVTRWLVSHQRDVAAIQTDVDPFNVAEADVKNLRYVIEAYAELTAEQAPTTPAWISGDMPNMDADDCIIFTNVVLNVRTGETIPVTDDLFATFNVGYAYQPGDEVPVEWFRFLRSIWSETPEAITELQKWFAYCLTCDTRFHKMLVLVGQPRSGKGIIQGVLNSVLGTENVVGMSISRLAAGFGATTMIGRRLVMFPDVVMPTDQKELGRITEALLSISGGDSITIPRKYKDDWNGKLNVKLMMSSNSLPRTTGTSGGLATRLHVLTMPNSFVGREDRGLAERLHAERHLIMNWAIMGLELLYKGGFTETASGAEAAQEMTDLAEPIQPFIRECLDIDTQRTDVYITPASLHLGYKQWCDRTGHQAQSQHKFTASLRGLAISKAYRTKRIGRDTPKVYVGVTWKDGAAPSTLGGF